MLGYVRSVWHRLQRLDPRILAKRRRFRRLNRGLTQDSLALRPGLQVAIDPRARESFEWFCFRSPEMAAELDAFLVRSRRASCFLDVGACHGIFSLAFTHGRPTCSALAVEPSPLAYEILEANIARNGGAIVPVCIAVGAAEGSLRMRSSWHHLEVCEDGDDAVTVSVPARTLDALCAERGFRPDLVKIDVEGYELPVLHGAHRLLTQDRPTLFLEVHPLRIRALGGSIGELLHLLAEFGYQVRTLDGTLLSRSFASWRSTRRLLCTPGAPFSRQL